LNQTIPNLSGFVTVGVLWLSAENETATNGNELNALILVGNKPYRHGIVFGVNGGLKEDLALGRVEGMEDGVNDAHGKDQYLRMMGRVPQNIT
jgi:hypothetical protein